MESVGMGVVCTRTAKVFGNLLMPSKFTTIIKCDGMAQMLERLKHPLDWGAKNMVLPKAYIPVNTNDKVDEYLCQILEAHNISELTHVAEYRPQELVLRV
jgi:hypothetical protein